MTETPGSSMSARQRWRIALWFTAVALLILPLIAMQFTNDVYWTIGDFVVAAILVVGTGLLYELMLRRIMGRRHRLIAGFGIAAIFLLVWAYLAVGF